MPFKNEAELVTFEEAENKRLADIFQNRVIAELGSFGAKLVTQAVTNALQVGNQLARVESLRADTDLQVALSNFRVSAMNTTLKVLDDATFTGYSTDLKGRAEITKRQPGAFNFTAEPDDDDRKALADWPIFGNTRLEIATNLTENMMFKVNNTITAPLRREIDVASIPQAMDELRNQFAKDVANQSQQAYLTGTQASQYQIKTAIASVAQKA